MYSKVEEPKNSHSLPVLPIGKTINLEEQDSKQSKLLNTMLGGHRQRRQRGGAVTSLCGNYRTPDEPTGGITVPQPSGGDGAVNKMNVQMAKTLTQARANAKNDVMTARSTFKDDAKTVQRGGRKRRRKSRKKRRRRSRRRRSRRKKRRRRSRRRRKRPRRKSRKKRHAH